MREISHNYRKQMEAVVQNEGSTREYRPVENSTTEGVKFVFCCLIAIQYPLSNIFFCNVNRTISIILTNC